MSRGGWVIPWYKFVPRLTYHIWGHQRSCLIRAPLLSFFYSSTLPSPLFLICEENFVTMVFDSEKQPIVSLGQAGDSASGGISSLKKPLIKEKHHSPEDYSVLAAIFLCYNNSVSLRAIIC
ncbi:hypothetical protein Bca52824_017603 [Brassica carinata]|uniref:Uncharacterized protein n=1 Tax=Brassica carinata TaxID=52824 RepID=A0A8X7VNE3_BRACI|nr:hypothetical protein Bca52824_017603 [Brassica carinata]